MACYYFLRIRLFKFHHLSACWDESPCAKKLFAQTMKRKYGSIDRLNAAWAASESGGDKRYGSFEELADAYGKGDNPTAYLVEYTKFMEDCFASLLAEGAAIVRDKVDPQALATFQPCTIRTRGIDLFTAYAPLGVVCSHTGGRGRENPPTDPGVVSFSFQLSDFLFGFTKLLPVGVSFGSWKFLENS